MYLSESLSFRDQLVRVLREVLLGLQDGHDDDSGRVGDWWFRGRRKGEKLEMVYTIMQ